MVAGQQQDPFRGRHARKPVLLEALTAEVRALRERVAALSETGVGAMPTPVGSPEEPDVRG
ncbi:hypothetical protein J7E88_10785 [Streptomyces sp. ISL-10]|uniref:hypothetical protein n=1 Tax=Streptomyces sp. ISL-10 TaxID=2819172 RepID=UPI001BE7899B|nr:hypothetical protein [Streptomyces sp. ISL-10]MBT2365785.1 hypothetical protein [Streptomyces sp. ISL-10]